MLLSRKVHNYSIFIKLLFFSIRAESHGSFATGELHNVYELGQERTWTGYFYKVGCLERGNFVLWRLRGLVLVYVVVLIRNWACSLGSLMLEEEAEVTQKGPIAFVHRLAP